MWFKLKISSQSKEAKKWKEAVTSSEAHNLWFWMESGYSKNFNPFHIQGIHRAQYLSYYLPDWQTPEFGKNPLKFSQTWQIECTKCEF